MDRKEAFEWLKKAVIQGHKGAISRVEEIAEYFYAEQGNSDAQFKLGLRYFKGDGVEKDFVQAFNWFTKSAVQGFADAEYFVGICYFSGLGVAMDLKETFEWLKKAVMQGHKEAINSVKEIAELLRVRTAG